MSNENVQLGRQRRQGHPSSNKKIREIIASDGSTQGFPAEHQYLENPGHKAHVSEDKIAVFSEQRRSGIKQNDSGRRQVGFPQNGLVPDVPFNPTYDTKLNNHLLALGIMMLALGALSYPQ